MGLRTAEQYKHRCATAARFISGARRSPTSPRIRLSESRSSTPRSTIGWPKTRKYRDLAVINETARNTAATFSLPRNSDDLLKRSELIAASTREGATLVVLIKEIGTDALYALHLIGERDGGGGQAAISRARSEIPRLCRDNDLAIAVAQTDVKGDRSLGPTAQEHPDYYVRVVEERPDGIVVRGAKVHTSVSTNTNEVIVLPTRAMRAEDKAYAVAFALPINTPGLKLIASPHGSARRIRIEHPISARHKMMETLTVFDDVFVPNERIFLNGEIEFAGHARADLRAVPSLHRGLLQAAAARTAGGRGPRDRGGQRHLQGRRMCATSSPIWPPITPPCAD